ncbi:Outer membrane protein (porin) [Variovorax sp. PDC80]|uniref:porin n=1 Tax=Variovorax sp. PDC80 TaxID=1882827 RepID=UPI0008F41036|nr:porin [Variovorax sp. PDC80]SFP16652.1 Outer membrane protein (porin) [Variovorax sp. PDC80]
MRQQIAIASAALLVLAGTAAQAQSTVTLYGTVDASLRYESHGAEYTAEGVPYRSRSRLRMSRGGGLSESFWGLKGSEDLGGGLQALFQVESHFDIRNGERVPEGDPQHFQIASVGLQSDRWGQLTFGRQYNVAMEAASLAYGSNLWGDYFNAFKPEHTLLAASKTNNMVHYGAQLGDVVLLAQYAIGEGEGSARRGSQIGAGLAYIPEKGPVKLAAAFMRSTDDASHARFDIATAGAQFLIGENLTLQAGYIGNRRDNAFTSFANGPFTPVDLAGLGIISPVQVLDANFPGGFAKRRMALGGLTWKATPWLTLAFNAWFTRQRGHTSDFDGSASQYQVVAGYLLSKRTMLYAEVDRSIYRGGLVGAQLVGLNAQSPTVDRTQTGVTFGVRHSF